MCKCKFTEKELYEFVSRADSLERVASSEEFLSHLEGLSPELYDDLMSALAYIAIELFDEL